MATGQLSTDQHPIIAPSTDTLKPFHIKKLRRFSNTLHRGRITLIIENDKIIDIETTRTGNLSQED